MARKDEAAELLKKGLPPSKIAQKMGISVNSVMGYLYTEVGEGAIRRSDILFSIDKETRDTIERRIEEQGEEASEGFEISSAYRIVSEGRNLGYSLDENDVDTYLLLRDVRVPLGDMYELLVLVEMHLHSRVRETLTKKYAEDSWWRRGVPEEIRARCAASREHDAEPAAEPYCYTNFIDLLEIIRKEWASFESDLPRPLRNKRDLGSSLSRLNQIRNAVMHPVKAMPLTSDDFIFVRNVASAFDLTLWRAVHTYGIVIPPEARGLL